VLAWLGYVPGPGLDRLSVSQVEALAEGEASRWERHVRLAATFLQWLPRYVALGVNIGYSAARNEKVELPEVPDTIEKLLKIFPDYRQPEDE
jgi:hypothetical protein